MIYAVRTFIVQRPIERLQGGSIGAAPGGSGLKPPFTLGAVLQGLVAMFCRKLLRRVLESWKRSVVRGVSHSIDFDRKKAAQARNRPIPSPRIQGVL